MFFVTTFNTGNCYHYLSMQMIPSISSSYGVVVIIHQFTPSLHAIIRNLKKIFATMRCTTLYRKCTYSDEKCNAK